MRFLLALGLAAALGVAGMRLERSAGQAEASARSASSLGVSPSRGAFVENRGQWQVEARYVAQLPGFVIRARNDSIWVQRSGHSQNGSVVRVDFPGSASLRLEAFGRQRSEHHFLRSGDADSWISGAASFSGVRYHDVQPGVDLVLQSDGSRVHWALESAADLTPCEVHLTGQPGLDGSVDAERAFAELFRPVPAGEQARNTTMLRLSTYFGGSADEHAEGGIHVEEDGSVTMVGWAASLDFPQQLGPLARASAPPDWDTWNVFVLRMGADGELLYSTLIGSSDRTEARFGGVDVDELGRVTVAGHTQSDSFPTTPGAYSRQLNGPADGFVFRLSPSGGALEYSTYLGGCWNDDIDDVRVAPSGAAVVVGVSAGCPAVDFPTTPGAYKTTEPNAENQGFVTRLAPNGGSLEWSTLLGGTEFEPGLTALLLDEDGNVTVSGVTNSDDFPQTPGAWDPSPPTAELNRAYVARLSADGSRLVWSTVFGGSQSGQVASNHLGVDASGCILVAGTTRSGDFPTTPGVFLEQHPSPGNNAPFVVRLLPDASDAIFSTLVAGPNNSTSISLAADASGAATITGAVSSFGGFPVTPGAFDTRDNGSFISRLDPRGRRLLYSTYLGGSGSTDTVAGVGITRERTVVVGGNTNSVDFPITPNAPYPDYIGGTLDGFVTSLDFYLHGVEGYGSSTSSCNGPIHANATEMPVAGVESLAFFASGAPPNSVGVLLIGERADVAALGPYGLPQWVHSPRLQVPVSTDEDGWAEVAWSLAAAVPGEHFALQFFFRNTATCTGERALSSSHALSVTVQ